MTSRLSLFLLSCRGFTRALLLLPALLAVPSTAHAWWDAAWTQRARVVFNTSAAGVAIRSGLNDVVVPVRLHSGNFDFVAANPDGSDLRVVAADDKTPLPFVVERFDGTNELALLWVKVPAIAPGTDANVVHVYAGNEQAKAEPAAFGFDAATRFVLHFGEKDGTATDAVGNVASSAAIPRDANGLLAGAGRFAAAPVTWGVPAVDGAAGATLSLWLRPARQATGVVARWGTVELAFDGSALVARAGTAAARGGDVPAGAWVHVAVTVSANRLALFVDGQAAAEAALGAAPALGPQLVLGEAYEGLADEVRLAAAERSPDWLRFEKAAQGADAKLVASTLQTGDGDGEGGEGASYIGILVKNLTTDAWVVIAILTVMFVVAAWVMVAKAILIGRADQANRAFLQAFRGSRDNLLHLTPDPKYRHSPLYRLYEAGLRELDARDIHVPGQGLTASSLNAVKAVIDADMIRETYTLNARMVLLTIAISGGPFLGLLGTVVGVMITFAAIAAAGDVNVNAIAPGIAAALLATVAGLGVAIPALFGYNWLASQIKNATSDMQIFIDEFITRVAELYGAP